VLDLYAGSGAVGLEALSRGAAHALLVESDARAARVVRGNVTALGLDGAQVRADRVERVVTAAATAPYDVVFLDPPYDMPDATVLGVLADLRDNGWLSEQALVVVERASRDGAWRWPDGFAADRDRRYGEATLWYGRADFGEGRD
jgi:16S rRNA (guanine966-N2)-methyltransferase